MEIQWNLISQNKKTGNLTESHDLVEYFTKLIEKKQKQWKTDLAEILIQWNGVAPISPLNQDFTVIVMATNHRKLKRCLKNIYFSQY